MMGTCLSDNIITHFKFSVILIIVPCSNQKKGRLQNLPLEVQAHVSTYTFNKSIFSGYFGFKFIVLIV